MVRLAPHLIHHLDAASVSKKSLVLWSLYFKALWRASSDPKRLVSTTSDIEHRIRLPARQALPGRSGPGSRCRWLRLHRPAPPTSVSRAWAVPLVPLPDRPRTKPCSPAYRGRLAGQSSAAQRRSVLADRRSPPRLHGRRETHKAARKAWLPPDSGGATWHGTSPASRKWEWLLQPAAPGGMLHPSFLLDRQTANHISID
jgi:hypothetical protein